MRRKGFVVLGFLILIVEVVIVALGSGFESPSQSVSYALTISGGALLVLAGFDADRFDPRVRWNHLVGTGLALVGLGLSVSGLLNAGIGTESIDRIAAGGQILSALIIVWFGWQVGYDTRHVNFDWMNSAE